MPPRMPNPAEAKGEARWQKINAEKGINPQE